MQERIVNAVRTAPTEDLLELSKCFKIIKNHLTDGKLTDDPSCCKYTIKRKYRDDVEVSYWRLSFVEGMKKLAKKVQELQPDRSAMELENDDIILSSITKNLKDM